MFYRKVVSFVGVVALALTMGLITLASASNESQQVKRSVLTGPINLAILIQDDLVPQVSNELDATADFIRSLPHGSKVMVAYVTAGSLQVRQPFTTDLNKAAKSLRVVRSSTAVAPFNPYVQTIDAIKKFDQGGESHNALLLISDGLDVSRGFDSTTAGHTLDIDRAIDQARKHSVAVYTFYAPSVGLTSRSRLAASFGQSSLNRLADETGGKAFFQGSTGFVSFSSHFARLRQALNELYARAY